jgi:lipopolysaccharide export LptBFGC system permease protein LptF
LRTLEEHYKTYAIPFTCMIFGAIGIPLGLAIKQGGRLSGFALGIAMALLYYIFMIIADFLATSHVVTPLAAAWLPNLIMTVVAVFLLVGSNQGYFTRWFRTGGR